MGFTPEQRAKAAETNRRKAEERRAAAPMTQGIGESKRFNAPEGTFPASTILDCHVGGMLVRNLPSQVQTAILYQQTDEGIAEANEGKAEAGTTARVTRDEFTGACQARRDGIRDQGMEPWEAPNPLKDVADRYAQPGMSPKFLSPRRLDKEGTRGFEVVRDKRGDPVKVRDMVLGHMPISKVEARNKFYRDKANAAVAEITKQYREEGREGGYSVSVGDIEQK